MNEISPDGQWRWDGAQWVPNPPAAAPPQVQPVVAASPTPAYGGGLAASPSAPSYSAPGTVTGVATARGSGGVGLLVPALVIAVVTWLVRLAAIADYHSGSSHMTFLYETGPLVLLALATWVALGLAITGAAMRKGTFGFAILVLVIVAGTSADWTMQLVYQLVAPAYG